MIIIKMISKLEFIEKQTLVINSDNTKKIKFRNQNLILLDEDDKILVQHPCSKIFMVFIIGEFSITSVLIKQARKFGVFFVFLNYNLKPYLSIGTENKGNFLLRQKQYFAKNDLEIAKRIVKNKIANQTLLMKSIRYKTKLEQESIRRIEQLILKIDLIRDYQELLGIEGNASKEFFTTYFKNLNFIGRKPRVKSDILNLLFDIGYTYLFNFIEANLEFYGFDNFRGVYHKLFYQRKSLVCDLIEPFRCIIDKKIKICFNLKQIDESDFGFKNGQFFLLREFNKKYSKLFLEEILRYKEEIFLFIQQYYRCFIKDKDLGDYPFFKIEKK